MNHKCTKPPHCQEMALLSPKKQVLLPTTRIPSDVFQLQLMFLSEKVFKDSFPHEGNSYRILLRENMIEWKLKPFVESVWAFLRNALYYAIFLGNTGKSRTMRRKRQKKNYNIPKLLEHFQNIFQKHELNGFDPFIDSDAFHKTPWVPSISSHQHYSIKHKPLIRNI